MIVYPAGMQTTSHVLETNGWPLVVRMGPFFTFLPFLSVGEKHPSCSIFHTRY